MMTAIVGSAPSVLLNTPGYIDSFDKIVRINNYKLFPETGYRTDIFYSFFGTSIKKTREELKRDGVTLCWCKCPNSKFIDSEWHEKNNKPFGVDFRYIYERRKDWWFCETIIPSTEEFLEKFHELNNHIPTTGMSAIMDLSKTDTEIYLTGFDFFQSKIHNVNEKWNQKNTDDPICHSPEEEIKWLKKNRDRFILDKRLDLLLQG